MLKRAVLKKGLLKFALWLAVSLLAGCQTVKERPVNEMAMPLLAVHDFGASLQVQQQVTGEYNGAHHEMLGVLELHSHQVSLVGLSAQGLKLFTLQYDGDNLVMEKSALVQEHFQPQQVLADIQLALWPEGEIQRQLGVPWRLQQSSRLRQLFYKNNRVVAINYETDDPMQGQFTLTNYQYGYSLRVRTLEVITL